jgi:uncharacterized membrane protein YoaK (UPF0700 family)
MLSKLRQQRPKTWVSLVAVALPLVAGTVDGVSLVQVGFFTSHMSGNSARLGDELYARHWGVVGQVGLCVLAFALGAAVSAMVTELSDRLSRGRYAGAFGIEAATLTSAAWLLGPHVHPNPVLFGTALLCFAMGVQNGVTSRIAGLVVRTTHMTGVLTDIGLAVGRALIRAERPADQPGSGWLHVMIYGAFLAGCALGAGAERLLGWRAALAPALFVLALAVVDAMALFEQKPAPQPT